MYEEFHELAFPASSNKMMKQWTMKWEENVAAEAAEASIWSRRKDVYERVQAARSCSRNKLPKRNDANSFLVESNSYQSV